MLLLRVSSRSLLPCMPCDRDAACMPCRCQSRPGEYTTVEFFVQAVKRGRPKKHAGTPGSDAKVAAIERKHTSRQSGAPWNSSNKVAATGLRAVTPRARMRDRG